MQIDLSNLNLSFLLIIMAHLDKIFLQLLKNKKQTLLSNLKDIYLFVMKILKLNISNYFQ